MTDTYRFARHVGLDVKWADLHRDDDSLNDVVHRNPYYEWIFVATGPLYLQVSEQRMTLQTGECLLLEPWESHIGWKAHDERIAFYWIQFSAEPGAARLNKQSMYMRLSKNLRTGNDADDADPLCVPRTFRPGLQYELLSLAEQLMAEMTTLRAGNRYRANVLLHRIMAAAGEQFIRSAQPAADRPALAASLQTYRKLVLYLDETYMTTISQAHMEAVVGRSFKQLNDLFRKYAGSTMAGYILELRMQLARQLLIHTNDPIKAIAKVAGYDDEFYFSRLFKKKHGMSPAVYRRSTIDCEPPLKR